MTTSITGGSVTFGRKVKPADYEGKDAIVMLSFNVEDGQDAKTVLDAVADMAKGKALEMVGLRAAADATKIVTGIEGSAPVKTKADLEAEAAAALAAKEKTTTAKRPPKTPKETPAKDPAAVEDETASNGNISTGGERKDPAQVEDEDIFSTPVETKKEADIITDVQLTDAISQHNGKIKNAPAIRALIGEYVKAPGQARYIAQDKLAEFITKLKALKAA